MQPGSDKHAARIDEGLEHDTQSLTHGSPAQSRAEEFREQEGPGDDEPTPDSRISGDRARVDEDTLSYDEIEARTDLARHLEPSVFPAGREELAASARRMHAPDGLLAQLGGLPDGRFDNLEAVWEALGGRVEFRG
jgi:hypothetical protein